MQTFIQHCPALVLVALVGTTMAATACGGSSSSNSDDSNSSASSNDSSSAGGAGGNGGTSGSDGASTTDATNTAATSATTTANVGGSGGTSAITTGGAGGTGGTTATSSGGAGGTSDAGGTAGGGSAAGGTSSTGGSGGTAGSGGTGPTGVIGVLGDPCDEPGQLACAGNHQKLTVVCGGDGEWEVNETCGELEYCDSKPGASAGICRVPVEECAAGEVDAPVCYQGDLHSCAPDGIEPALVEDCVVRCEDGACIDEVEPCPEGDVLNCDPACGDTSECFPGIDDVVIEDVGDVLVFRTAGYADAVDDDCTTAVHALFFGNGYRRVMATVAPPWRVIFDGDGALECGLGGGEQCAVSVSPNVLWIYTDDASATPSNVTLQYVYPDAACP